jgi:ubiquitin-activating enzyme E1
MYLWNNRVYNFEDCIKFSINRFYDKYNHMIKQLLHAYPKDTETTSGVKFWSGSKRCPKSIESIDIDYVYHTSLLVAKMFNIDISNNEKVIDIITNAVTLYKQPKYEPSDDIKVSANDNEEKENAKSRYESLDVSLLPDISEMNKFNINSIEFEKDDDTNHHIDFIKCSSNLRATNYDIPVADRYETKIKAGKIIPAISTTTSLVSGLVTIEMIKYILGKRKIDDFKNTFLNLGLSLVAQSEPMPTTITKIKDKNITVWDYYNLYDDLKVSELLEKLSEEYKLDIDTISYGSKLLISPMTGPLLKIKRQEMKLSQLLQEFNIVLENNIYELQVSSLYDEEESEPPNVKFHYTTWSPVEDSVI